MLLIAYSLLAGFCSSWLWFICLWAQGAPALQMKNGKMQRNVYRKDTQNIYFCGKSVECLKINKQIKSTIVQFARGIISVGTLDTTYSACVSLYLLVKYYMHILCFVRVMKQGCWKNNQRETNGPVFSFVLKQAKPFTCPLSTTNNWFPAEPHSSIGMQS